jgi:putative ABC transport system substrate-binding protein
MLVRLVWWPAAAEEVRKLPKVGQLYSANPAVHKPYDEAFRDGLRSLGYVDGKNIVLIPRHANGDYAQFPRLLSELIALEVDVLVVSLAALPAAIQATRTIPVVAPTMGDPVKDGFVDSLSHPGRNLTGGSVLGRDAEAKRLQFAMELVPSLKRIGLLFEATNLDYLNGAENARILAEHMGLSLRIYGVHNEEELRTALVRLDRDRLQVLILWSTPFMLAHREGILQFTAHKMPVIGDGRELAHSGAIITYAADYIEMWRRGAVYVDRILKGGKPSEIPIEQTTKFVLRANLRTAKDFSITIPESILLQADEIIR